MEQKFKVGDRVRHGKYGEGSVVHLDGECLIGVSFDGMIAGHDCDGHCDYGTGWYYEESELTLVTSASPTPDRAMIAAMAMQGLLASSSRSKLRPEDIAPLSVRFADALIAELQKPKP